MRNWEQQRESLYEKGLIGRWRPLIAFLSPVLLNASDNDYNHIIVNCLWTNNFYILRLNYTVVNNLTTFNFENDHIADIFSYTFCINQSML